MARIEALAAKIAAARALQEDSFGAVAAIAHSRLSDIFHELEQRSGRTPMEKLIRNAGYNTSVICDYGRRADSIPVLSVLSHI